MTNTDHDLACELARYLVRGLDHLWALSRDRDRGVARDLADDLDLAEDLAFGLVRYLAHDLDIDIARPRDLASELVLVLGRARGRACDHGLDRDLESLRGRASDLESLLAPARDLDLDLESLLAPARDRDLESLLARVGATASSGGQLPVPMLLAGRLTAVAARLLPSAERARYGEEFRSELAEIALAGGGRRPQLAYAYRTVLSAAWQLRAALRTPRRRGAVQ